MLSIFFYLNRRPQVLWWHFSKWRRGVQKGENVLVRFLVTISYRNVDFFQSMGKSVVRENFFRGFFVVFRQSNAFIPVQDVFWSQHSASSSPILPNRGADAVSERFLSPEKSYTRKGHE